MPRHPHFSKTVLSMRTGVFSKVAYRIAAIQGERFPFHVGDTYLEPAEGARLGDLSVAEHPGMHRYTLPQGHPSLLAAVSERRGVDASRVLVSAGATAGLGSLAVSLLNPGDEVLILSPYWPLIRGIVMINRGVAVDVTLIGPSGRELDMGSRVDQAGALVGHACTAIPAAAQRNRMILLGLMAAAGWDHYLKEWWHYQLFEPRRYPVLTDGAAGTRMMAR